MNQDPVTIKGIDWLRVFPVLNLWHAVRMGFRVRVLLPCLLTPTWLFVNPEWSPTLWRFNSNESRKINPETPTLPSPINMIDHVTREIFLSHSDWPIGSFSTLMLAMLFTTLIGIAVARATATEFCRQTRTGAFASLKFAVTNFTKGLISLALTIGITAAALSAFRLVAKVPALFSMNSIVTNLCFPFVLLLCLLSVLTALVCVVGWLFSLAAIGTDRCSGADALSRGINYVLSHKLYTTTIAVGSIAISYVCARIVRNVLALSMPLLNTEFSTIITPSSTPPPVEIWDVWLKGLQVLPNAVQLGVFLAGMTIGYVLLRQAEDAVRLREMDGGTPHTAATTALP